MTNNSNNQLVFHLGRVWWRWLLLSFGAGLALAGVVTIIRGISGQECGTMASLLVGGSLSAVGGVLLTLAWPADKESPTDDAMDDGYGSRDVAF